MKYFINKIVGAEVSIIKGSDFYVRAREGDASKNTRSAKPLLSVTTSCTCWSENPDIQNIYKAEINDS